MAVVCSVATDGFVSQDGRAGWAFIARDGATGAEMARGLGVLEATQSHAAEWVAVVRALAWAERALGDGEALELRVDSALVAKGLASRRPAMSGEAAAMRAACRQALARLSQRGIRTKVVRIRREENAEADALARGAAAHL